VSRFVGLKIIIFMMKITIDDIRIYLKENETTVTFEKLTKSDVYIIKELTDEFLKVEFKGKDEKSNSNKKRIFFNEIINLVNSTYKNKRFNRTDFEIYCPKTKNDGGCGYAVIIRLMEKLNMGKYLGHGKGFEYIN
jgi:hypothetical protein